MGERLLCKLGVHKWRPIYIGENNKWRIVLYECSKCSKNHNNILRLLSSLKYYDFGTFSKKYYDKCFNLNKKEGEK